MTKSFLSVVWMLATSIPVLGQPLVPIQWYQICTPHVDIIFKGDIAREAQRVANTLGHLHAPIFHSLGMYNKRIALIINNQKVYINGFAQLGPYKISFNTFPTQDYNFSGSNDWLHVLATHESRHAAQYAMLKQNLNQLAYTLGGELFLGGLITANVPLWLLEGDAVDRETELTASGRGRIPYFFLQYKTNLLTGKKYSYEQQRWGSLKHPLPNHYPIGYLLTAHLRKNYGDEILAKIFKTTTLLMPFPTAVKKNTGRSIRQIYKEMNEVLQKYWQKQLKDLQFTETIRLNPRKRSDYIDYTYPRLDKQGRVIVLRSGIGTVKQFVALNHKKSPQKICTPGDIHAEISFSTAQNKIVWIEQIPDPRWADRSYGVIQCYDTQAKRLKTLTHKSRYGSAELSPDATKIVAFESTTSYDHQLVIMDAENGQVLQRLPNPDNHFYLTPKWSEDGKQIVVVKNKRHRLTIALIDISTGETKDLLPYSTEPLGCPVMKGNYVLYNSAYSGIDNIYAMDLATCQQYQVTSSKFGAYHPSVSADNQWLLFNDFTEDGMDAVKIPFMPQQWTPLAQVEKHAAHAYAPSVEQEDNSDLLATIPKHVYPVERYHPWQHTFNVHSWLTFKKILLNDKNPQKLSEYLRQVSIDIVRSNNLLDNAELVVNYSHDFEEKFADADVRVIYQGWYPIISLAGKLRGNYKETLTYSRSLELQLKIPWELHHGQYTYKPSLATTSKLSNNAQMTWCTQTYEGFLSRSSKKSPKDIYPPWEQKGTIKYEHVPYGWDDRFIQSYAKLGTTLYFPGLARHHSLGFYLQYEYANYEYTNKAVEQEAIKNQLRTKQPGLLIQTWQRYKQFTVASIQYDFPICYPDCSLGHLLYVKRLRAEAKQRCQREHGAQEVHHIPLPVFQNSNGEYILINHSKRIQYATQYKNTISMALFVDLRLLTFLNLPQVSLGIRRSYCLEKRKGKFHIEFSTDINF